MRCHNVEILAPAGSREALVAAVRCGADAVYLGGKDFSARQNAQNFDAHELQDAVAYCHERGVKVYLTINTLLTDRQFPLLKTAAKQAAQAGVDAVIVQDLGVLSYLRSLLPNTPLHASTQMAVHSPKGAQLALKQGCSRVVLARECSADEIASITKKVPIQTEVFVHGALCMGMSGQCYLSANIGRRSANRGMCAGTCRLPFVGGGKEYALSLKDLSLVDRLGELCDMGVSSFKIEGRMKRPEYVAAAVTACRDALEGRSVNTQRLAAVFSRSGFTDGYYTNSPDAHRFGFRQKEDVRAAGGVLGELSALYRSERGDIAVNMHLKLKPDTPSALEVWDEQGHRVCVSGQTPQPARTSPTDADKARSSLGKTGGTPYKAGEIICDIADGLMMPMSAMNALRSSALVALGESRRAGAQQEFCDIPAPTAPKQRGRGGRPTLRARLERPSQLTAELAHEVELFSLPYYLLKEGDLWQDYIDKLSVELPPVLFEAQENSAVEALCRLKKLGVHHANVGNLGGLCVAQELGYTLHSDYTLNPTNTTALGVLRELGIADATLSIELGIRQAADMTGQLPTGLLCYGKLPLMYTRSCPIKGAKGCGGCRGTGSLADRLGNKFDILCTNRHHVRLLNAMPLYTAHKMQEFTGFDFLTLYFTDESAEHCLRRTVEQKNAQGKPPKAHTSGLYFRDKL